MHFIGVIVNAIIDAVAVCLEQGQNFAVEVSGDFLSSAVISDGAHFYITTKS